MYICHAYKQTQHKRYPSCMAEVPGGLYIGAVCLGGGLIGLWTLCINCSLCSSRYLSCSDRLHWCWITYCMKPWVTFNPGPCGYVGNLEGFIVGLLTFLAKQMPTNTTHTTSHIYKEKQSYRALHEILVDISRMRTDSCKIESRLFQ